MQIGLTGLIGSGKTIASNILAEFGAHIIDADILTRYTLSTNTELIIELKKIFPESIFINNSINKKEIAQLIFNDKQLKTKYEHIIHPEIDKLYKKTLKEYLEKFGENSIIIYDAPLLFEVGYSLKDFSHIILITASKEICIKRIIARNNCTQEEAYLRFNSQIPLKNQKLMADIIVENDGTIEELRQKLNQVWLSLTK